MGPGVVLCCAVLCCCAGALLFVLLLCCVVGFIAGCHVLVLAALFLLVFCGALRRPAVLRSVALWGPALCVLLCCVGLACSPVAVRRGVVSRLVVQFVLSRAVVLCCLLWCFFGVVWYPDALCHLVWHCTVLCCACCVVFSCPPPLLLRFLSYPALRPVVLCRVLLCVWCFLALCWCACNVLFGLGLLFGVSGAFTSALLLCALLFPLAFCSAVVRCAVGCLLWCVALCCAVLCHVLFPVALYCGVRHWYASVVRGWLPCCVVRVAVWPSSPVFCHAVRCCAICVAGFLCCVLPGGGVL